MKSSVSYRALELALEKFTALLKNDKSEKMRAGYKSICKNMLEFVNANEIVQLCCFPKTTYLDDIKDLVVDDKAVSAEVLEDIRNCIMRFAMDLAIGGESQWIIQKEDSGFAVAYGSNIQEPVRWTRTKYAVSFPSKASAFNAMEALMISEENDNAKIRHVLVVHAEEDSLHEADRIAKNWIEGKDGEIFGEVKNMPQLELF